MLDAILTGVPMLKRSMKFLRPVFAVFLAFQSPQLCASPLASATLSRVVNDVDVVASQRGRRHAARNEILDGDACLLTGSRAT